MERFFAIVNPAAGGGRSAKLAGPALERLRKLAFAETVPAPKIPEQIPLELPAVAEDEDESAD